MGWPAGGRFSTSPPPEELRITFELANTIGRERPAAADLLARLGTAQAWLDDLVADWCLVHSSSDPSVRLGVGDLERLIALRERVRAVLAGRIGGSDVSGDSHHPSADITGGAVITVRPFGVDVAAAGGGVGWVEASIAIEMLMATCRDQLRRLKVCQHPECGVAFFDRSRNNSGVWHNTRRCGNPANVRAYRQRQRDRDAERPRAQ